MIQRLVSFPNVILTAHQAFFTREALEEIMNTTLANVSDFAAGRRSRTKSRSRDHQSQKTYRDIETMKAWSQNLGHDDLTTTFTSYGL